MSEEIKKLRTKLEQDKGKCFQLKKTLTTLSTRQRGLKRDMLRHEKAREIIRTVGIKTQQQLSFHISDITSLALEAVFPEPYALVVDFVQRRNKTECDLLFEKNKERMHPLDASGGGAVDVAAFALRIASWSMTNPKSRSVMILDEPMRFVSADLQQAASEMLKEISTKLGIQFIIVTHENTLAAWADKTFEIGIKKGISFIK